MDLEKLSMHFRNLAVLGETDSPVISCYINNEAGRAGYRDVIDARIREIRKALSSDQRLDFEQALGEDRGLPRCRAHPRGEGRGALFPRVAKRRSFRRSSSGYPSRTSCRWTLSRTSTSWSCSRTPTIATSYSYATESHARIVEVSVGNVTKELWTERPELRKRVGREWTKEHYQNHRRDRTQKFIKEKIEILDRLFAKEATHPPGAGGQPSHRRAGSRQPAQAPQGQAGRRRSSVGQRVHS